MICIFVKQQKSTIDVISILAYYDKIDPRFMVKNLKRHLFASSQYLHATR
jgi:hypothetical protein